MGSLPHKNMGTRRDSASRVTPISRSTHGTSLAGDQRPPANSPGGVLPVAGAFSMTLPWPPKELSPNFRTRSTRWIARIKKEYKEKVSEIAWDRGVRPERGLRLDRIVFHPPTANTPDDDNIANRFKAGRDGLADAMGVDDKEFNDVPKEIGAVVKGGAVVVLLSETPA